MFIKQEFLNSNKKRVVKIRYLVKAESHTFEIDVFKGKNKGLIVAEVELNDEGE